MSRHDDRPSKSASRQAGFSLIMAIFLIVVLAALAAFAVQIAMSQYQAANVQLLEARAQAAADAGMEWAANQTRQASPVVFCAGAAPVSKTFTLPAQAKALKGFVVTVACTPTQHQIYIGGGLKNKELYTVTSTATIGTYGSPDYVSRAVTRNLTNAPP